MFELFKGLKVDWLGKRKLFFAISSVLLLVGMASLVMKGQFVYGTDFKGGTVVVVKFPNETVDIGAVRDLLPEAEIQAIQTIGSRKRVSDRAGESRGERGCDGRPRNGDKGPELGLCG